MKLLIMAVLIGLASLSHAKTTYNCNNKEVTKGEAMRMLITGVAKSCVETRVVVFSDQSGGLKQASK